MEKQLYLSRKGVIYVTPMFCKDLAEAIFMAKITEPMEQTPIRIWDGNSKLLWRSENAKDYPFGCEEVLKNAKIIETYDNAVDLEIAGRYIIGVYCYYDNPDCIHPIAGEVDYDYGDGNVILSFTDSEKKVIQSLLDKREFKQFQFGKEFISPGDALKEVERDER